ncbi:hypothetical protein BDW74DRAFT_178105 [Aspergillus multicolor]|uniref:DUF4334 domain-containing protein n=1 Tax=Aspergillus multicolor TaxID=41759 RepID=UPI003CCCC8FE
MSNDSTKETLANILASKNITPLAATTLFNSLPPLAANELLGQWHGTCALTNHPGITALKAARWVGKNFHTTEDVHPIISLDDSVTYGQHAPGEGRVVNEFMGKARIREIKYNGVVSTAMVYNDKPIIDYFRRVDERTVMGVMDAAGAVEDHPLYFVLERLEDDSNRGGKL